MNSGSVLPDLKSLRKGDRVQLTNCYWSSEQMKDKAAKNGFKNYVPTGVFHSINKYGANVILDVNAMMSIDKQLGNEYVSELFEGEKMTKDQFSRIVTDLDVDNIIKIN